MTVTYPTLTAIQNSMLERYHDIVNCMETGYGYKLSFVTTSEQSVFGKNKSALLQSGFVE